MSNASLSYTKYYNGSWQNPSGFTGPYVKGYQTGSYLFGVLYTVTINVTTGYKVTGITFTIPRIAALGSSGSTTLYALLYNSDPQGSFSGATAATPWKTGSASVSLSSTESQKSVSVSNLEITSSGTYYVFLTTNDNNVRNPYINLTLQSSQITCSVTDSRIPTPATSISVSSTLYMGTQTTISWTPYTSGYTYKVTYKFTGQSSETNIVASTSSSSQTWTPATTLSANIPNSTSGTVTIYVYSYLNGTQIGSKCSGSFTLNIPSSGRAPTGSSGWYTHGCSKVAGSYVSGYSDLLATIDSSKISPKYNATISSIKTTCNGTTQTGSGTNLSLGKAVTGTNTITTVVTDSRGYTLTVSTNFTALAYTPPSFSSLVINRCNSSGTTSTSGTYYAVTANVSYTTTLASNTLTIQTHYKKLGASSYTSYVAISNNTKSVQGSGNITTTDSYIVEVRAYDTVVGTSGAVYQSRTIVNTSVAATFNLAPNGISAAFFGLADNSATKQLKVNGEVVAESMSLTTPLPIASGGTNASTAANARTQLGVVAKAGDTMTGNLIVSHGGHPKVIVKSTDMDTTAASLDAAEEAYFAIHDKNNKYAAYMAASESTAGLLTATFCARRVVSGSNVDNYLSLRVANDGAKIVSIAAPVAWRGALGVGFSDFSQSSTKVPDANISAASGTSMSLQKNNLYYSITSDGKYFSLRGELTVGGGSQASGWSGFTITGLGVYPAANRTVPCVGFVIAGNRLLATDDFLNYTIYTNGNVRINFYQYGDGASTNYSLVFFGHLEKIK